MAYNMETGSPPAATGARRFLYLRRQRKILLRLYGRGVLRIAGVPKAYGQHAAYGAYSLLYAARRVRTPESRPPTEAYGNIKHGQSYARNHSKELIIKRNIMALTYMTKEGYQKKMQEIAYLESVERPRVSAAIAEARDKGDLSENSEYDAAKEAQGMLEMKIAKLKDLVANARIIDESKLSADEVSILSRVKMRNAANGMVTEYTIVADSEANLREKKIGVSTPIAKGLLGHKVGDLVEITVPAGVMKFEIQEISVGDA